MIPLFLMRLDATIAINQSKTIKRKANDIK
jgi:hypothetical protein